MVRQSSLSRQPQQQHQRHTSTESYNSDSSAGSIKRSVTFEHNASSSVTVIQTRPPEEQRVECTRLAGEEGLKYPRCVVVAIDFGEYRTHIHRVAS